MHHSDFIVVEKRLAKTQKELAARDRRIAELEAENERLRGALNGLVDCILVERGKFYPKYYIPEYGWRIDRAMEEVKAALAGKEQG